MNQTLGSFAVRAAMQYYVAADARDAYDAARARHEAAREALRRYLDLLAGMRPPF